MTMPAGKYYIGDLCYVMDEEWDEVCSLIIQGNECVDGEFVMKNGTRFACYGTMWGDGAYRDQDGRGYSVDSGTIGCVLVDDIQGRRGDTLGQVVEFTEPFDTYCTRDGVIVIGHVRIDTNPAYGKEYNMDEAY